MPPDPLTLALSFSRHPRAWRALRYIYPVISRRSRGLSIGVNLNPDRICNFDCVYCEVDRSFPPSFREIDLVRLEGELRYILADIDNLFEQEEFRDVPPSHRRLNDIAFSGDGEPTTCPLFPETVGLVARVRRELGLDRVKIILITNATRLSEPRVAGALALLDRNNGEIWAKLDAGTQQYFARINRAPCRLEEVLENILSAAMLRPVIVQSLFIRLNGQAPLPGEIEAWLCRLRWLLDHSAKLAGVQVYTVARPPGVAGVSKLEPQELECIAAQARALGLNVEVYP